MPEASASVALAVNDRVVYPNQGVCRVTAIEPMEVAGQRLTFVTLKREEDGALVRVPQSKVVSIGVRKVATADEVGDIFEFLRADTDRADLDWKQRARTNLDRMTTGGLRGLAEVVKGLAVLSELRPLPTKERELYDNARHLLVAELSAALNLPPCNAEDAVDIILFPPGRERPKRTAEEFRQRVDLEGLELDEELLGLDTELELPSEEEAPPEEEGEEEAPAEAEAEEEEAVEEAPRTRGRPPKARAAAEAPAAEAPKKRGRPPKAKAAVEAPAAGAEAPRKRGRPPKAKVAAEAPAGEAPAPRKRGRPPKARTAEAPAKKK